MDDSAFENAARLVIGKDKYGTKSLPRSYKNYLPYIGWIEVEGMSALIEIVNYHPGYAASIAEMWNRSQNEWGGGTTVSTAEQVRQEEENSDSLAVFLAVCQDEVVGYCSVSEYREDTGALYIQLLNVRPDYHGKKVGKMLVLRAVEETIRRGWPRLDLYTWEGNMKAVPLYKRCGFFWEDREEATHFMNFIPQVVHCEALEPYMAGIDWYADSTRTIEVVPDGRDHNGFQTYTYAWSKDGRELRVDFERRGRGICLIETHDYLLSAAAESAEPVFGKEYTVQYRVVNKSEAPLRLDFQGEHDRNISFDWQQSVEIAGGEERTLTARFFVGEIEEEQSEWRTCPTVRAAVTVNGRKALLQVGVVPKFPANVTMKVPDVMHALQGRYEFYLDVENHYPEAATFSFELPAVPWLDMEERSLSVSLEAKGRTSLAVPYRLADYGFYEQRLEIAACPASGGTFTFRRSVGGGFRGPGAMCAGETERARIAVNGKYSLEILTKSNQTYIRQAGSGDEEIMMLHPAIGKPYSGEFSKRKPERTERKEERGAVGFKLTYRSVDRPHMLLHTHSLLYADGTVKMWYELENDSDDPTVAELWVSQRVLHDLYRLALPYGGRIVETSGSHGNDYAYWDGNKVDEPWLYSRGASTAVGLCWSDGWRMNLGDWYAEVETCFGRLQARETKRSGDIVMSCGGFDDWQTFRDFALKRPATKHTAQPVYHIEFAANGGNPFVSPEAKEVDVTLRDAKSNVWEGEIIASYSGRPESAVTVTRSLDEEKAEARFTLSSPERSGGVVEVNARLGPYDETYRTALFPLSSEIVKRAKTDEAGKETLRADNGRIQIAVSAGHYAGLRSLAADGRQWLATGFPEYGPKSWWNPWPGGMYDELDGMRALSVLKEERSASFVDISDDRGNVWSGIRARLTVKRHETFKGLTWDGYYLLLPGVPVLAYITEIRQETGTYLDGKRLTTEMFLQQGEAADWMRTFGPQGETMRYRLGKGELQVEEARDYAFGRDEGPGVMHIVTDESVIRPKVYSNKDVACVSFARFLHVPHGSVSRSQPVFFVFADGALPPESLRTLRTLTFPGSAPDHTEGE